MFRTWLFATRPWSFTAAFVPVALGTALAWYEGTFHLGLFLLAALGGIALQAGTNMINTYGDFVSGVDTPTSARNVPFLVDGLVRPNQMKLAGLLAFGIAGAIGVALIWVRGWPILALGILGIVGGYSYTAGPRPWKYKGLGSVLVFFLMGPAMVWGAYYVQTGRHSTTALLASLPVAFLVSAILHANDLRDLEHDRRAGISTFALILGEARAFAHYYLLLAAPFVCLAVLVAVGALPWVAALPVLMLPRMRAMMVQARDGRRGDLAGLGRLEPDTGAFHLQFGLLLCLGVAASHWILGVHP